MSPEVIWGDRQQKGVAEVLLTIMQKEGRQVLFADKKSMVMDHRP